jgi:hypothetical protein
MIFGTGKTSEFERLKNFLRIYPCNMPGDAYVLAQITWEGAVKGWKLTINQSREIEESIFPDD